MCWRGITNSSDVKELLELGADKVLLNSILTEKIDIIKDISKKFGAQCIVAGVDYKVSKENQEIEVWSECGKVLTNVIFTNILKKLPN